MAVVLALVVLWNSVAVALGVLGAINRRQRRRYAIWVGAQMLCAAGLMVTLILLGSLGILVPGEVGHALRGFGLFVGVVVWAACGLVPMTVMVVLSARRRTGNATVARAEHRPTPSDRTDAA